MPAPPATGGCHDALWTPSASRAARTHLAAFARAAAAAAGRPLDDYWALHAWSVAEPDAFWQTCLRESGLPYAGSAPAHTSPRTTARRCPTRAGSPASP